MDIASFSKRTIIEILDEIELSLKDRPLFCDSWHSKQYGVSVTLVENVRKRLGLPSVREQRQERIRKGEHDVDIRPVEEEYEYELDEEEKKKTKREYLKISNHWDKTTKQNVDKFLLIENTIFDNPDLMLKEISKIVKIPYQFVICCSTIIHAGLSHRIGNTPFYILSQEATELRKAEGSSNRRRPSKFIPTRNRGQTHK